MEYTNTFDSKIDPHVQLELLRVKCKTIAPVLYRSNACYLDIVRDYLPNAIKSSLFHLITEPSLSSNNISSKSSRNKFQAKAKNIILENISFLTVEQLLQLANSIEKENKIKAENTKKQILDALQKNKEPNEHPDPQSSIDLDSSPPLDNSSVLDGWNGSIEAPYTVKMNGPQDESNIIEEEMFPVSEIDAQENNFDQEKEVAYLEEKSDKKNIDIFQSIFLLAANKGYNAGFDKDDDPSASSDPPSPIDDSKINSLMPETPLGLLEWINAIEMAISYRLRNLSHSINVELLRSGLINSLIPLSLLDAVISGQITSNNSFPNILSLKLPVNTGISTERIDIDCLLVTPSDLEFDNPHLRKSKLEIKKYRQALVKMIKQERYWQRRALANEVRQQWWKNSPKE